MKGLIIKQPWIDKILSGEKTWEIRGSNTNIRGTIALIKSGTGMIFGTAELVDSRGIGHWDYIENDDKHRIPPDIYPSYPLKHAWVLQNPIRYDEPIPYKHPQGAVIWVNLEGVQP